MAKTLLEFEGHLLDVMSIYRISLREVWNEGREDFDYCIVINPDFPEKYLIKDLYIKYESIEHRSKMYKELKNKAGELEHVVIL